MQIFWLRDIAEIQTTNHEGTFTLRLEDYTRNIGIRAVLPRWFISYIAERLWDVINQEEQELAKLKAKLKFGCDNEEESQEEGKE